MTTAWTTTSSTHIEAMVNSINAASNRGSVPDEVPVLENPGVTEQVDRALELAATIIDAYDTFQRANAGAVLLFSNDRDFVERARSHRVLAQRVELPDALPREVTCSWAAIQDSLYVLTILSGVLTLPKVTLYGVWNGKGGKHGTTRRSTRTVGARNSNR